MSIQRYKPAPPNLLKQVLIASATAIAVWEFLGNTAFFTSNGLPLIIGGLLSLIITASSNYIGLLLLNENRLRSTLYRKYKKNDLILNGSNLYGQITAILFIGSMYLIAFGIAYDGVTVSDNIQFLGFKLRALISLASVISSDILLIFCSMLR